MVYFMSYIEVDQSGKVEQLRLDTVVALSNDENFSVLLPKKLKREVYMENKGKNDKEVNDVIERLANDNWEENVDNLFAYLRGNEILKVCEELVKKKYKLV